MVKIDVCSVGVFSVAVVVCTQLLQGCQAGPKRRTAERRLFDTLMRGYDPGSRPVVSANTTVKVNFSIALRQIMDLAEKNQTLITHVWIYEEWVDETLRWRPGKFKNIETIILPAERVWLPDVYIFNNADKGYEGFVTVNESRVIVDYDGRVEWVIPLIIKSSCAVDVTYFPFDNQICFLRFGSWNYDEAQLDPVLKRPEVDMTPYSENSELDLVKVTLTRTILSNHMFPGQYPQMTMHLYIRRKPLYYAYTVLAPTLVLCILTLFSFLLPCDNGDKVGIGLTVFLSLYVLQLGVAENIPESNSLPLIGLFLTLVMTLNAISLVFATLVINIKKKGDRRNCPLVPNILLRICKQILSKVTCMPFMSFYDFYGHCEGILAEIDPDHQASSSSSGMRNGSRGIPQCPPPAAEGNDSSGVEEEQEEELSLPAKHDKIKMKNRKYKKLESPEVVEKKSKKELAVSCRQLSKKKLKFVTPAPRDPRYEWFFVAEVLDKSLFFLFLIAMVVTVTTSLVLIPWLHKDDWLSTQR